MTQYNQLNLSNRALQIVKQNSILSLDEDSKEALAVNFLYFQVKNQVLSSYYWKCSTLSISLNLKSNKDNSYLYALDLPSNFIASVKSGNNYVIKSSKIYSNSETIKLTYIANITEEELDLYIIDYFIYKLALELSYSFINDLTFVNYLRNIAEEKFKIATNIDSKNNYNNDFYNNENLSKLWVNLK